MKAKPVWLYSTLSLLIMLGLVLISNTLVFGNSSGGAQTLIDTRLDSPLYKEQFKITSVHSMTIDGKNGSVALFSGNGTLNGIAIKSSGKGLITPRSNETTYIHGRVNFTAADNSSEKASYILPSNQSCN